MNPMETFIKKENILAILDVHGLLPIYFQTFSWVFVVLAAMQTKLVIRLGSMVSSRHEDMELYQVSRDYFKHRLC
jgi:hypothetical protein